MFDLRKNIEKNLDVMISMTKEYYGDIEISNEEFLKWQYYDNPSGSAYIRIAYDKDEPAGQYIIIPMYMKVNDKIVKCTLSLNTLTREKYREKKVFTMLAEQVYADCKEDGAQFTYGFPNQNSFPGFIRKLNFKNIGFLPLLVRPLDIKSMVYKGTNNNFISKFCNIFRSIFFVQEISSDDVFEIDEDDIYLFDEFWKNIENEYDIIGIRDSKYINWRYRQIPLRKYKIFGIKKVDKLVAYAVLRNTKIDSFDCGMIVDFLFIDGYEEEAIAILKHSISYFNKIKMDMVGCLMNHTAKEYEMLKKLRFIKVPKKLEPQPFPVILRVHDENLNISDDIKNWFLTMGDYDAI